MLVEFKGKVMTGTDWDDPDLPDIRQVRIPVITPSHVVTPWADLTMRERLFLDCRDRQILKARTVRAFKAAGTNGYSIPVSDPRVTLLGNGFMALVRVELDVRA